MKRNTAKIRPLTDKQLEKLTPCSVCGFEVRYGSLYFYVDESNASITNNSRGICINCKIGRNGNN